MPFKIPLFLIHICAQLALLAALRLRSWGRDLKPSPNCSRPRPEHPFQARNRLADTPLAVISRSRHRSDVGSSTLFRQHFGEARCGALASSVGEIMLRRTFFFSPQVNTVLT